MRRSHSPTANTILACACFLLAASSVAAQTVKLGCDTLLTQVGNTPVSLNGQVAGEAYQITLDFKKMTADVGGAAFKLLADKDPAKSPSLQLVGSDGTTWTINRYTGFYLLQRGTGKEVGTCDVYGVPRAKF